MLLPLLLSESFLASTASGDDVNAEGRLRELMHSISGMGLQEMRSDVHFLCPFPPAFFPLYPAASAYLRGTLIADSSHENIAEFAASAAFTG